MVNCTALLIAATYRTLKRLANVCDASVMQVWTCISHFLFLGCGKTQWLIRHPIDTLSGSVMSHTSQASSPYLNYIGGQDKPTVEQLFCRWCLMLHFLAVTIWTLSGHHNLASSPFWCFLFGGQISSPHDLYSASETSHFSEAVKLASYLYSYCSVIVAWSLESRKKTSKWFNIDMDDHDLTKSRIVQISLGFLWHWSSENVQSSHMKKLALDTVHAGHLEVEDHHPEHEKMGMGLVDVHKLFVDRLCSPTKRRARQAWGVGYPP